MQIAFVRALGIALISSALAFAASAKHALIVAIDDYAPAAINACPLLPLQKQRGFTMVSGQPKDRGCPTLPVRPLTRSVADGKEFRDILATRYHFGTSEITELYGPKATATSILGKLDALIANKLKDGDSLVFYFAGHGVKVRNTQRGQNLQQALVPFDYLLGAYPILDTELITRYRRAVGKNIRMAVVLDSCYSGGGSRGEAPRWRSVDEDNRTVNLSPSSPPTEKEFGFLASAGDAQPARDNPDTFTQVLVKTIRDNTRDLSLEELASMTAPSLGVQVPKADGAGSGILNVAGELVDRGARHYVVSGINQDGKGPVRIPYGTAQGITNESEFILENRPDRRFRVEHVELLQSWLSLVGHNEMPAVRSTLTLAKWVPSGPRSMVVHVPASLPSNKDVETLRACLSETEPPKFGTPGGAEVFWSKDGWRFAPSGGNEEPFRCEAVKTTPSLKVNLPPTREMRTELDRKLDGDRAILQDRPGASFALVGRLQDGRLQYALATRSPMLTTMLPPISAWNQDWHVDTGEPKRLPEKEAFDCLAVSERCALYLQRRILRSRELVNLVQAEMALPEMITEKGLRETPWKIQMRKMTSTGKCTAEEVDQLTAGVKYCLFAQFTGTVLEREPWHLTLVSIDGAGLVWQDHESVSPPLADKLIGDYYISNPTEGPGETLFLFATNDQQKVRRASENWQHCPAGECASAGRGKDGMGLDGRPDPKYSIQRRTFAVVPPVAQ